MQVSVNTFIDVSNELLLEILNVAINGGCLGWAAVTEKNCISKDSPVYAAATFTSRSDSKFRLRITTREIAQGIENVIAGGAGTPDKIRRQLLRIVAENEGTEIDLVVADHVVRAVMNRMAYAIAA